MPVLHVSVELVEQYAKALRNEIQNDDRSGVSSSRMRVRATDLCKLILDRGIYVPAQHGDPYGIVNHGNHAIDIAILGLRQTTKDGWTFTPTAEEYGVGFVVDSPNGERTWTWLAWSETDAGPRLRWCHDANRCPETMMTAASVAVAGLPLRPKLPRGLAGPGEPYPEHRNLHVDAQVGDELRRYTIDVEMAAWLALDSAGQDRLIDEALETGDLEFVVINSPDLTPVIKNVAWA